MMSRISYLKSGLVLLLIISGLAAAYFFRGEIISRLIEMRTGEGAPLPNFSFMRMDSIYITEAALERNREIMVMYFNPGCDDCIAAVDSLRQNAGLLDGIQLLLVSPAPATVLVMFYKFYKLSSLKDLAICHDQEDTFYGIFGANSFPTFYLYSSEWNLQNKIAGDSAIFEVMKVLRNK